MEAAYDLSYSDAEMAECVAGHIFCQSHASNLTINDTSDLYEIPKCDCPICSLSRLPEHAVMKYYFKKNKISVNDVMKQLRSESKTLDDIVVMENDIRVDIMSDCVIIGD
jgi:hypothetical protein